MLPWVVLGIVLAIGLLISVLHTSITYYLDKDDNVIVATIILIGGLLYLCKYKNFFPLFVNKHIKYIPNRKTRKSYTYCCFSNNHYTYIQHSRYTVV